ncbi:amino acid adenylation [Lindgomyces ingoldianus]|uniref:Amino acid adenylation n=1 Tax=Lindgomyces ingoldianus TaxID=673940 RepID=A0ACB6R4Z9_9PLEO|nr:amino acid adenylation [Lindgomyces ingoldianus]KAF2474324.1 amino acid adenylation [Lindgomyces ingoldianus]
MPTLTDLVQLLSVPAHITTMGSVTDSTAAVWLWNGNVPSRIEECAHELIHKQAKLRPHALAVDAHDGTWTYAELDEASNRVAHYLVGLGIRPENVVPLCFEKSRWAIVGILGVLKAGAAMVFLDPSHPESRRQHITSEVEAKVIISSPQQAHLYGTNFPPTFILSKDTLESLPHHTSAPKTIVQPSNLLYIIFTSGSTGTPKGCLIEHRAFLSGSLRHAERANIISSSRVLQLASYTFDVSMLEIITSLIHGACICTPDMAMMTNGPAYIINEYKITWTFMTPSLVKLMAPSMVPTLKTLALGGEPLSKIDVENWAGQVQLVNGYGPSECSVAATGNTKMTPETDPANIGYPVGGICWIVDAEDHDILLPPNEVGELLIEGPILARGYLKNKEKTDEVFIERPAWGPTTRAGEDRRFYKTGDLAKFLPDGSIYFIGRKDTQVKLRGLRIELGEIEHHIGVHPQVRHRMVILPKKGLFANRLVTLVSLKDYLVESMEAVESTAYVHEDMYSEEVQGHIHSIREGLKANVPEYMVPETWIVLERFPLLISGKLNRSFISNWVAEADNELYRQVVGLEFEEAPDEEDSGSVEEQLRSIISAVLNLPLMNISLQKSFLSLGGDSITAMQVMARCRGAGLAVSVKDILRSKSITDLSYCIKSASETAYSTEEKFDVAFELSPVQRMYFDIAPPDIDDSRQTRFNQSFFLKVERPVAVSSVARALELVVAQHSMLRVRFIQENGRWMQYIQSQIEDSFSFKVYDINTAQDAYPIMTETQTSLDTQMGPIFAVALFNTASEGQQLFLVAHHVMIDLVSWRVILRDLEEVLTTGLLTGEKPLPFQNWLALQSDQAKVVDVDSVLPYTIPSPDFDYWGMADKPNRMCDTQEATITLDSAQTRELLEGACHVTYNTEPIDILLASLVYSFNQIFSDRPVPALFREGHGREPWDDDMDISGTVGWFTTMYPLYVDMKEAFSMLDVVKRAKDVRHSVPANGRPYFASRYLNEAGIAKFGSHDHVEVSFDYLGLYQQMERSGALLTQVPGYQAIFEDVGKEAPRFALVEITAEVLQGQMQLLFVFNKNMKNQNLIQSWIKNCKLCLANCLDQLQNRPQELTLSDFPLLKLTYEDLNTLVQTKLPEIGVSDMQLVESVYPSSPMQHGLLISQVRAESQGAYEYNHTLKVETRNLSNSLDIGTLEVAWAKVVQRHTSLRTVFVESVSHAGLYDQVVFKTIDPNIYVQQCKEDEVDKVFSSRGKLAFYPGGALHRFTICPVSATAAICKLEINHAIIDGSSIANLMGDFIMAYDGHLSDRSGFAFEDYIKHVLERPVSIATNFWKEYLAGINPCFFPLMAHWEDAIDPQKKLETVSIDVGMTSTDLTKFCNDKNVTLVNIFQFAWGLVLKQYIGSEDVCFGYLSSGRDAPLSGIEEGVGAFITMLVSRMVLEDSDTMSSALEKVADDLTRTLPNQHCGLAEIHHALKLGSQPLFNTIISFHRETDHELLTDSSIKVEAIKGYDPTEYALSLDVGVTESKIEVTMQFWTSDFTLAQAQNIGATLAEAVRKTVNHSEKKIGDVDLVSASHLEQLRKITSVYPQYVEECVHHAIESMAAATPDSEAVCSYEGSWTYEELNNQATRLAHHLVSLGVGPEVIVPYCFQKSGWAIVSILAILKAGAAGVAFDPNHPISRLEGLVEQTGSTIILAAPQNMHLFTNTPNVEHVVGIDADFVSSLPVVSGVPNSTVSPENSCFIVFTSGTTGKPKGIILEHRNLRTCCTSMGEVLGFGPNTRALQFAAYNFDVSLQDILTTLQMGGTICVISDEERMNDLAGGINRCKATWADLTATVSGMLKPQDVPTMQRLNNGGEPLNRDVVETWADHVEFYNLYGPAETTVNQTASVRLSKTSPASNIGPAYGTHVWIVNDQDSNRLVPMGCAGEILIEGPLLARGYLKDPAKTAAAFIENPTWVSQFPDPNAILPRRFYKSGDIGCLNTDGSITIVGRRDAQVKINGQRVELDEIMYQAQLVLPEDYQAVIDAISVEGNTKSKTIVAFITNSEFSKSKKSEDQLTFEIGDDLRRILKDLQGALAKVLPFYMIPSLFVPVFNIPYTNSGKLDRPNLRSIVATFSKDQISHYQLRSTSHDQPQTPMEQVLQTLFSQILSIQPETIGRDDSFFGLGGDSVGAMKMVSAARKRNVTIKVADIFKYPTLSEMALTAYTRDESIAHDLAAFSLIPSDSRDDVIAEAAAQCSLSATDIEDIYPTSALQEGMMALGMRKRGAYIAQKVFRLPQCFNIPQFQSAWAKVIEAEAILRTRIVCSGSGNLQVVHKLSIRWQHAMDLEAYLTKDQATSFQYGEQLMRLAIVNEEYFVWTAHHAIYDGWSVALLFEKVAQAYEAQDITSSTPYKGFIGRLQDVSESASVDFWTKQFTTQGSFPTSYPEVGLGYSAASKKTISIQGYAPTNSSNILPSTIKRAAWALTMATYADSEDVVFAQTLSGRSLGLEGIDSMMGPTITTVPVRVFAPKSGITIRKFLENVQNHSIASIDYEHFGLQNIRDVSAEARTTVDNITNLFVLQPADEGNESYLNMEPVKRAEENFDTYPLVILCNLSGDDEFNVEAMYDEDIIPTEQMTRMLHQFEHFVRELSGDASRSIEQMSLLNKYDLKDVTTWNAELPGSIDARIPDLVLQNVAARPNAEAISAWDGSVTYRELDLLTSKLANHLVSLGVGPEIKVGLCFDKSMWNVITMFAVMRTGGVCVQLLPNYPMPRMLSILEDIEANVVIVSPQHANLFNGIVPNVISIEQSFIDALPSSYETFVAPQYGTKNAAFIVFTSGSTGKPKGVIIEHRGFCTMAHYQLPKIQLDPDSRVLQFATHTFDICLFESFAPLVKGACVCVPSEYDRMNNLVEAINTLKVDWVIMVSTVADTFHPDQVPGLKSIILGGEPLRADIHARWASRVNLFNDYGPAECSILAVMTRSYLDTPPSMIGKSQGGRAWVVDKANHNRLVPVGCIGELLIEGPLLARGYLKNPEKTAESYIYDPTWVSMISPVPTRLYKTGDLVRYVQDGNMLCLGRKDTQIKIRGLRIELGEIEHHVKTSSFGAQKQAVEKILLGGDIEKPALAAFVVPPAEDIAADSVELLALSTTLNTKFVKLKEHIAKSLQAYMVPSLYIPLRRIPETQTNKIDRNALKRIGASLSADQIEAYSLGGEEDSSSKRAPSTTMEIALQSLWAELLRIEPATIGADDSFFSKGGDSIKAMRLTSMARNEGIQLIVADIFKNPVLCDMATVAVSGTASFDAPITPFFLAPSEDTLIEDAAIQCAVSKGKIEDIYPCTPLQEGLMELATQQDGAYTAQRVFRIQDSIDIQRFKNAWGQLVALHPILRTRIVLSKTSGAVQVVLKEDISWQSETGLPEYLARDKTVAIKYGSPLARYALDSEHRHFIWTVHHALYDGHSANILMEQLEGLYNGVQIDAAPSYNRFIKLITEVDAEESKGFWKNQLGQGGANSFPALPSATYKPSPDSEVTRTIEIARDASQGFMLSTILRAAWAIVTSRYMGSEDIAFAATNSGRNAPVQDIGSIVGPTITTVPIQLQINATSTIPEFLSTVQQQSTKMIPFEHAGIQNIYSMTGLKQNLKNLFVIQQPLSDIQQRPMLEEVLDKELLRGFHIYAAVVECMVLSENKIDIELQFDHKALPEASARIVLDQFEHVVHQLVNAPPSASLKDIGYVTPAHVQQMVEWNNRVDIQPVEDCVHNIFRQQVKLCPDAHAVTSWDGSLTYRQLDQLTDKLASFLVEKGVEPEYLVPMCFDKSMFTIVAMMATLKAGGACVHLGRNSPIARMSEIIEQTGASIVLTDNIHASKFDGVSEAIVIDQPLLDSFTSSTALPEVSPSNPAFVLFTSGSTGKPKGVVVEHGSLCTSSRAHGTNRKIGPHTRLLQFAAYTFDVSVADIFTTLQRGGCICVPSEDERINDLAGAINRMNCNYGFLTPTVAGMLDPKTVPGLKRLILGGELLTQDNVQRWAPMVDLIISYGMTECSIHCVDAVPLTLESDPANLGRPSGCHMWIVDAEDHNKLAPIGAVGELVIEGRMVSRGYLNDKAKTDAAFILDPLWAQGSGKTRRMYKTGDLCRYSSEGEICYVSRKDFQVKHHGQRIELSEIEHHLVADSRVKHAVVLLPKTGYLQKRLIAVLSLESLALPLTPETQLALVSGLDKGMADVQVSGVRNHLATKVPDYMVPAVWVITRALPLTPNNKMDRVTTTKWLTEIDERVYESIVGGDEEEDGAPATAQQKRLHDILAGVLGLPSINMNRSFLDLGGDSITAMQLRAKGQAAGISLTVRDILTCESISHLVVEASFLSEDGVGFEEVVNQAFPLTAWQQACIDAQTESQTLLLRLASSTTVPKIVRAIEALVQQHSMLRARFALDAEGHWSQTITKELATSYKFEAHAIATSADVKPFLSTIGLELDIENGPLFSARLFDLTEESNQQTIAITVHPLIADTTSIRIIAQDLREMIQGNMISSKKTLSFQSRLSRDHTVPIQETPTVDLTAWGINKAVLTTNMVERSFTIPSGVTSSLLGSSNNALSTEPTDILVAILAKGWNTVFGRPSSIAIKEESRTFRTVGQFNRIRQLPKTASQDFIQLLSEVKDSRAQNEMCLSLTQPLPAAVEMLVESIDYTTFGNEEALQCTKSIVPQAIVTVSAIVVNGEITLRFTHSSEIAYQVSFASFINVVKQLIPTVSATLANMARKATLSDFPLLKLEYAQLSSLEKVLSNINVPLANVNAIVPCTPLQQRMLNSQKVIPGSYESDTAHKITTGGTPSVDITRLQYAWKAVVARHEALRTIFIPSFSHNAPMERLQLVLKEYVPMVDVIQCDENNITRIIESHHTVDHTSYRPHVGFTVFQTESSIYCKLEISHALQDGMSTRIIYQDLVLAYQDLLPEGVAPGFKEYVKWLAEQDLQPSNDFWTGYIADIEGCQIPRANTEPDTEKGENVLVPITLDVTAQSIAQLCRTHKITSATLFQAAWTLVLRAFTGKDDVLFGYITANRELDIAGVDELVGPMINMLACRLEISENGSGLELLNKTHEEFLKSLDHQHGFVAAANAKEEADGMLPFNSVLSIEYASEDSGNGYYSAAAPDSAAASSSLLNFDTLYGSRAPEFDVVLGVLLGETSLEVQLGYWNGIMEEGMMKKIAGMYKGIVEEWVRGDVEESVKGLAALKL